MKALIRKELRQLSLWGLLLLIGEIAFVVTLMVMDFDEYHRTKLLDGELPVAILFGGIGSAAVLGFLQVVLEIRRDTWAFLRHRGLSATQVFVAKGIAALVVYAVVTLIPAAIGIAWCRKGGVNEYPFAWSQILIMPVVLVAPVGFYFAAMLAVIWRAPWHISRVFPLVVAWLLMLASLMIAFVDSSSITPLLFLAVGEGALGVAAWGVFVSSGEANGRPDSANVGLGVAVLTTILAAFLGLFAGANEAYAWYLNENESPGSGTQFSFQKYFVNRQGHICRHDLQQTGTAGHRDFAVQSVVDLDDVGSNRYQSIVGHKSSQLSVKPDLLAVLDFLPTTEIQFPRQSLMDSLSGSASNRSLVVEELGITGTWHRPRLHWLYSSADGWIYGYLETAQIIDNLEHSLPPMLAVVVGPDGFTDASHRPQRRFGKLLANSSSSQRTQQLPIWPVQYSSYHSTHPDEFLLLFEDGLYGINLAGRSVQPLMMASAGRKICCLTELQDEMAVVYRDLIEIHSMKQNWPTAQEKAAALKIPGELKYSFPLPKDLTDFPDLNFGRVPGKDVIVFHAGRGHLSWRYDRIVQMKLDGTILSRRDFRQSDLFPTDVMRPLYVAASFLPVVPLLLATATDAADHGMHAVVNLRIFMLMMLLSPGRTLIAWGIMTLVAVICGWMAYRTAKKYGFTARTQIIWVTVAISFGPAGLLALWFLRDWPALETCRICTRHRPVDRDTCPRCGACLPLPALNGSEIIIHSGEPVLTQAC